MPHVRRRASKGHDGRRRRAVGDGQPIRRLPDELDDEHIEVLRRRALDETDNAQVRFVAAPVDDRPVGPVRDGRARWFRRFSPSTVSRLKVVMAAPLLGQGGGESLAMVKRTIERRRRTTRIFGISGRGQSKHAGKGHRGEPRPCRGIGLSEAVKTRRPISEGHMRAGCARDRPRRDARLLDQFPQHSSAEPDSAGPLI